MIFTQPSGFDAFQTLNPLNHQLRSERTPFLEGKLTKVPWFRGDQLEAVTGSSGIGFGFVVFMLWDYSPRSLVGLQAEVGGWRRER